jgi:Bacterial aa3 type cytochrome c oxidase subunit IV
MAEQQVTYELDSAASTDFAEHEHTYLFFLRLLKYASGGIIVVLVLMAFFLL